MSPQNANIERLLSEMMVLEGGASGADECTPTRDHRDRLFPFCLARTQGKEQSMNQEALTNNQTYWCHGPDLREINFCCL